jgi:hypothetical protein
VNELAVPTSAPGGVPARLSTAASGGGGGICRNDIVENYNQPPAMSQRVRDETHHITPVAY